MTENELRRSALWCKCEDIEHTLTHDETQIAKHQDSIQLIRERIRDNHKELKRRKRRYKKACQAVIDEQQALCDEI